MEHRIDCKSSEEILDEPCFVRDKQTTVRMPTVSLPQQ